MGERGQSGAGAGLALGFLIAGILNEVLTLSQQWLFGWRIGFALGSPIAVLAVLARSKLSETEAFKEAQLKTSQQREEGGEVRGLFREAICGHGVSMLLVFCVTGLFALGVWMASAWLQVYETELIGSPITKSAGVWINMGCILFNSACVLVAAALMDCVLPDSRRALFWVMIAAGSLLAVCAPFLLMGMSQGTQNMAGLVLS